MLTQPIWHEGKEVDVIEILLSTRDCDAENNFNPDIEMVVYDIVKFEFTTNGKTWHPITIDHL